MKAETSLIINTTLGILLFGMVSSAIISHNSKSIPLVTNFPGSWACTTDSNICPDGSMVGRVLAYCEFASCENSERK